MQALNAIVDRDCWLFYHFTASFFMSLKFFLIHKISHMHLDRLEIFGFLVGAVLFICLTRSKKICKTEACIK